MFSGPQPESAGGGVSDGSGAREGPFKIEAFKDRLAMETFDCLIIGGGPRGLNGGGLPGALSPPDHTIRWRRQPRFIDSEKP